tara:strand:+ start:344 stop:658 length:315 start_codon:yes stop_codon:yes gene_type:complete
LTAKQRFKIIGLLNMFLENPTGVMLCVCDSAGFVFLAFAFNGFHLEKTFGSVAQPFFLVDFHWGNMCPCLDVLARYQRVDHRNDEGTGPTKRRIDPARGAVWPT